MAGTLGSLENLSTRKTEMPILATDQSLHLATTLVVVGANTLTPDWEATSKDPSAGLNLEEKSHRRASNDERTATPQNCPDKLAASQNAEFVNTSITAAVSQDNPFKKQLKSMIGILELDTTDQVLFVTDEEVLFVTVRRRGTVIDAWKNKELRA